MRNRTTTNWAMHQPTKLFNEYSINIQLVNIQRSQLLRLGTFHTALTVSQEIIHPTLSYLTNPVIGTLPPAKHGWSQYGSSLSTTRKIPIQSPPRAKKLFIWSTQHLIKSSVSLSILYFLNSSLSPNSRNRQHSLSPWLPFSTSTQV